MTNPLMDKQSRDLILATEIMGLLHDLGKLHPEFAQEKSREGKSRIRDVKGAIQTDAHGAILEEEDKRAYPEPVQEENSSTDWLQQIKQHDGWAKILKLPQDWIKPKTVQAFGLGDALRQHHAKGSFPEQELTLLGDIYTVGADWRDSALDKGSGNTLSGEQQLGKAYIADSFGNELKEKEYSPAVLENLWYQATNVIQNTLLKQNSSKDVPTTRQQFLTQIEPIFRQALGETRRPTNDVTLWHHSFSAASLFKVAVTEGVLRQKFNHLQDNDGLLDFAKLGRIRFRLLGIRWNWAGLTQGALVPIVFFALTKQRQQAIEELRKLLEIENPIGNIIYEDDDGAVLLVPGFYEQDEQQSEHLFQQHIIEPLKTKILNALVALGAGTPVRIAWTQPRLYLTDYPEVMNVQLQNTQRELLLQVGEEELLGLWKQRGNEATGQVEICNQCGLRPTSQTRHLAINESNLKEGFNSEYEPPSGICEYCEKLAYLAQYKSRWKEVAKHFSFQPETFNLRKIRQQNKNPDNARIVLISVRIDTKEIADGTALLTQVARPLNALNLDELKSKYRFNMLAKVGDFLETQILANLNSEQSEETLTLSIPERIARSARVYLGEKHWLDFWLDEDEKDGRIEGSPREKSLGIVEEFFLRECVPATLFRHEGDCLALFGMRKHPSPGRLARVWDDLRQLWKDILQQIAEMTKNENRDGEYTNIYAAPLSLDAQGFRVIVAAEDAREVLTCIHDTIQKRLGKVRASFNPHVSALVFKEKFPLYVAFDAMRRMEKRVTELPAQEWKLTNKETLENGHLHLTWQRLNPNLEGVPSLDWQINWTMNLNTGDPGQTDLWYPHVICTSRPEGPGRIVHINNLQEGDTIQLRPATFDFMVLEGTARRYQLAYDMEKEGRRYHFILGESGRPTYLLEQMPEILNFVREKLTEWDATRRHIIFGQIVEYYEKWVRDVPESLQEQGRQAWYIHVEAILLRYLPGKENEPKRNQILGMLEDGRFFDAFEWAAFVEKSAELN